MNRFRRRAAFSAACDRAARCAAYSCEPLEQRLLLDGDPVIVLTEPFDLTTWPGTVNEETVGPWLWKNSRETEWDLSEGDWDTTDGDENGYDDDAYGWNFTGGGSPNILGTNADHGATIVDKVLRVLNASGTTGDRVRIMHVIGTGAQIVQYVIEQKALDANIVAVSNSKLSGNVFTRTDAETLRAHDIVLFVASDNGGANTDPDTGVGRLASFYHATPRSGIQEAAVQTIIPVTTDPSDAETDYGRNSFYFAASRQDLNIDAQSYAVPVAAAYAVIAAQAYQDEHSGDTPTPLQIKRAMMSGLAYQSNLNNKTIAHDYDVVEGRQDGGVLDLDSIIDGINDTDLGITGVSMTEITQDFTTFAFSLNADDTPTNWTISWGDNSFADGSGVEVLPGAQPSRFHQFPFENIPHSYFPTIYAMLGTGNGRQVYLQSTQLEVEVTTAFAPTSGPDEYTLIRSGNNTVLTLDNSNGFESHSFAPNALPTCLITLGDQDTLTVDFTNGDPLETTALTVKGSAGANTLLSVIGTDDADEISVEGGLITINGTHFSNGGNLAVEIDAGEGDDSFTAQSPVSPPVSLKGGDGSDTFTILNGATGGEFVVIAGSGDNILEVGLNAASASPTTVRLIGSENFAEISIGSSARIIMNQNGAFVLGTKELTITSGGVLNLNDNDFIVDYTGTSPLPTIATLIRTARNGGVWNGAGITTSSATTFKCLGAIEASSYKQANTGATTFDGISIDNTAVLVKFTYYGDSGLNGQVDGSDYARIDAAYNLQIATQSDIGGWFNGDSDYNGKIDGADYALIDAAFNGQGGPLGPGDGNTEFDDKVKEHRMIFNDEDYYDLLLALLGL